MGIPSVCFADGPSGIRKQEKKGDHLGLNDSLPATCFPAASAIANSWNTELAGEVYACIGQEARQQGVSVVLGPGLNIKRNPLCGRNFEYFSEDPYLSGKMAAACIRGAQSRGVAACPKHFAANSQENFRMSSDSIVDERTLREIYLTNFEIAVKEGKPWTIMTSYNRVNGIYANENKFLLTELLEKEWGFDGAVISDWGGGNCHTDGVKAGCCVEMPGTDGDSDSQLAEALKAGDIEEAVIDQRVRRILRLIGRVCPVSMEDAGERLTGGAASRIINGIAGSAAIPPSPASRQTALKAAEQSIVLLKNENSILPLKPGTRVAVIGSFAEKPRYQGAGSSLVKPTELKSAWDIRGDFALEWIGFEPGFRRDKKRCSRRLKKAVKLAEHAEAVLLYLGLPESEEVEGMDRKNMKLPENQTELLRAIAAVNRRIIVILAAGSPIEMPWKEECRAIVHGYLGGQEGAAAMMRIITGAVNPSGKLAETYPIRYEDVPSARWYPGEEKTSEYREGLYIGYRYYETTKIPVCYPFGFGLSYTEFSYGNLTVKEDGVEFQIENTGSRAGAEVAQMYIHFPDGSVFHPVMELKGFARVFLEAGERRTVTIAFDDKTFRYFNPTSGGWEMEGGVYRVMIGASVKDIRLESEIVVSATAVEAPWAKKNLPDYYSGTVANVPDWEFELLLGRKIPEKKWNRSVPLGINDTVSQMVYADSRLARISGRLFLQLVERRIAKGTTDLNMLFLCNVPFRGIAKLTNGLITVDMAKAFLLIINGNFRKGVVQLKIACYKRNKRRRDGWQNH